MTVESTDAEDVEVQPEPLCYLSLDHGVDVHGTKGAAVHVRSICRALASLGHEVHIHCSRCGGGALGNSGERIEIIRHPLPRDFHRLRRSLREFYQPQLIIPPEVRQCAINRDAVAHLREAWDRRRPSAVIERLSLMGVAGVRVARELGIPHLLEVNALLSEEAKAHRALTDLETARQAEDEALRGTGHVFTVSALLREAVIARGVEPGKVEILCNACDQSIFSPRGGDEMRNELGIGDRLCVAMAGSMKSWHGIDTLLEGFRRFAHLRPDSALLLIGTGPKAQAVTRFRRIHPDLQVITTGPVAHEKVAEHLSACDVAVAPYERSEPFHFSPMKIPEYLAMGKPVVASRQGQIEEIITHGENGLLIEPGDAEALKDALVLLCDGPGLRVRLGRAGIESVRGRTWTANARRLLAAAREVTA
jgi:glycosyltransferase involved in cell wall biosynthesis